MPMKPPFRPVLRLWIACMLAVWTRQQRGDLLKLTYGADNGSHIRLRRSKTGKHVVIPARRSKAFVTVLAIINR